MQEPPYLESSLFLLEGSFERDLVVLRRFRSRGRLLERVLDRRLSSLGFGDLERLRFRSALVTGLGDRDG